MKPAVFLSVAMSPSAAVAAVVLSEIHYNPPAAQGRGLEFVEVHNASQSPVNLSGWQLTGGIEFAFAAGTTLSAGGYLVVSRNREAFEEHFGGGTVAGDFRQNLADSGDEVQLRDASNALVDTVRYDDRLPWPEGADGEGDSSSASALRRLRGTRSTGSLRRRRPAPRAAPRAARRPPTWFPESS